LTGEPKEAVLLFVVLTRLDLGFCLVSAETDLRKDCECVGFGAEIVGLFYDDI
jgi:hypothetical protein